ncbi:MAG: putative transrane protein [Paucimonas sp.]|jgi:hypothetical protein|nr:putative transrane protein [Paucimonas sp.]
MISSTHIRRAVNAAAKLALCIALVGPAVASAAEWNIDVLMKSLAESRPQRATFVEKKYLAQLDRPVESSGELRYTAPNHLEKRTLKPRPENLIVDGDVASYERGSLRRVIQLSEIPEMAGLIDSIRGTLAGDRRMLERSFRIGLEGKPERWFLQLKPLDIAMGRNVHAVRIAGAGREVRSVEVTMTDGDRSVMTIEPLAAP